MSVEMYVPHHTSIVLLCTHTHIHSHLHTLTHTTIWGSKSTYAHGKLEPLGCANYVYYIKMLYTLEMR